MAKISVVIPVYNAEDFIERTLLNLQNQTFPDYSLILVDDGSKDNTAQIIQKYAQKDNRIKYVYQENMGAGTARNNGFNFVDSEYVIWLDSDDEFETNMLARLYQRACSANADITICLYKTIDMNSLKITHKYGINRKMLPDKEIFSADDVADIFDLTNFSPFNKLYKTDFVKSNHLKYTQIPKINDLAFSIKALSVAKRITVSDEELLTYKYMRKGSITANENVNAWELIAYKDVYDFLKERELFERFSNSFYKMTGSSLNASSPLFKNPDPALFNKYKKFYNSEPWNRLSLTEKNRFFDIENKRKKFFKYKLRNLLCLGLNRRIKQKSKNYELLIQKLNSL